MWLGPLTLSTFFLSISMCVIVKLKKETITHWEYIKLKLCETGTVVLLSFFNTVRRYDLHTVYTLICHNTLTYKTQLGFVQTNRYFSTSRVFYYSTRKVIYIWHIIDLIFNNIHVDAYCSLIVDKIISIPLIGYVSHIPRYPNIKGTLMWHNYYL